MTALKASFLVGIFGVLVFVGCSSKKPKPQTTYTTIKCQTLCKDNHCNQKCIGVEEVK